MKKIKRPVTNTTNCYTCKNCSKHVISVEDMIKHYMKCGPYKSKMETFING